MRFYQICKLERRFFTPASSLRDLTPLHFFLREYLEDKVFQTLWQKLTKLKRRIPCAVWSLNEDRLNTFGIKSKPGWALSLVKMVVVLKSLTTKDNIERNKIACRSRLTKCASQFLLLAFHTVSSPSQTPCRLPWIHVDPQVPEKHDKGRSSVCTVLQKHTPTQCLRQLQIDG